MPFILFFAIGFLWHLSSMILVSKTPVSMTPDAYSLPSKAPPSMPTKTTGLQPRLAARAPK
ncbi:hypothetical protein COB11_06375 [Candidatus Aerophobetes bacterium]|uniref:Uncharacterized protein n=1 Tax=Aerophobetes bacterium TaxID=2030807 RepID=A0A2A4YEG2_UNCAE|nr:MAG: hypothetical protein COB11_06375 [Candidatus Aerophobetes bacterium]